MFARKCPGRDLLDLSGDDANGSDGVGAWKHAEIKDLSAFYFRDGPPKRTSKTFTKLHFDVPLGVHTSGV